MPRTFALLMLFVICCKLSLWIKNVYCEAIVADLLVDYQNACVIGKGVEGWMKEFEAFLAEFPRIVPWMLKGAVSRKDKNVNEIYCS
jgi:hypothetical protein